MAVLPTLLFDGACGICRTWVSYWQALTQERVVYRPYQEAAADYPALATTDLAQAIYLIAPDGEIYSGAAASFRLLAFAPGHGLWFFLYRYLPGFAPLSEWTYNFLARRRGLLALLTWSFWGQKLEPARHALTGFIFLRLFGVILIAAFASLSVQILGLIGHDGLLPVASYLTVAHQGWGTAAYWRLPSLFWFNASDAALLVATLLGAGSGLLVLFNLFVRPALIAAFILYLSLIYAGQIFLGYQWDELLVETSFLAIFLTTGSPIIVFLFRFLAFRFLFLAGVAKLQSGDASWRDLTALDYHFWTQPLPAPLAVYAAELPQILLQAATAATLIIELVLVFFIFLPRRPRMLTAFGVILFQLGIIATGNYNFFNLLTMLLCLFLFDDQALRGLVPAPLKAFIESHAPRAGRIANVIAAILALVLVPVGLDRVSLGFGRPPLPVIGALDAALSPLLIVNSYGLFATMTTMRPEIVIEGSDDGTSWRDYVFKYYPGPLSKPLSWNIPHQPRLDWQMWFAAYGNAADNPWFIALLQALLEARPQVLGLLARNPFPDQAPLYVRATLFDYVFADPARRAQTGQWWLRRPAGLYFPQVSLADLKRPQPGGGGAGPP
jgi:predicted DCC family thiol-disulfide oxidoreductase YuxK